MDIQNNVTLPSLRRVSSLGIINQNEEIRSGNQYLKQLRIKAPSVETVTGTLSGGTSRRLSSENG